MKFTKYPELKMELKKLAKEIKEWKRNRKEDRRFELRISQWEAQSQINWRKDEFRHKHIAYCMLRGRKYEQIENCCKVSPNFDRVNKIMEEHGPKVICASA
jgi:hypothetical protein